jgi:hypothetical protein
MGFPCSAGRAWHSSWLRLPALLLVLMLAGQAAVGEEPPTEPIIGGKLGPVAAASMVAVKDGPAAIVMYRVGNRDGAWSDAEAAPTVKKKVYRDPNLDRSLLEGIEDDKDIPSYKYNPDEYRSYLYTIVHAHDVPVSAMEKAFSPKVGYVHMMEQPVRFRGELIKVDGYLKQLRELPAPRSMEKNDGIKMLYEGLVTGEQDYREVYWVVFTELPAGLDPAVKIANPIPISFYAYFFKRTAVEVAKSDKRYRVPLLVARTVTVKQPPELSMIGSNPSDMPVVLVIAGLTVTLFVAVGIIFWFRSGDKTVRSRLARTQQPTWVPPTDDSPPAPPSSAPNPAIQPPPS